MAAYRFMYRNVCTLKRFSVNKYAIDQVRFFCDVKQTPDTEAELRKPISLDLRFRYPEFLPDPKMEFRNPIREKLERRDMLDRRSHINIPEFYVGSILSVTSSNQHAPIKNSRFVGICILREGCGLRATFTLRNVIDNMGIDMAFTLYDPKLQKIEVLRLEKRLDEHLLYLRDAYPDYSTIPLDMEPEYLPEGTPVPINPIKVKLKPPPWRARYELHDYKGIENVYNYITPRRLVRTLKTRTPWEKYDLMKQYRVTIPIEEQQEIYSEVYPTLQTMEITKKKIKRKKEFVPPKKTA